MVSNIESWKIDYFEDKSLMKIFLSITKNPKSAKSISQETAIPLNTVYRKLRILKEKELVQVSGSIENGVRNFLYSKDNS